MDSFAFASLAQVKILLVPVGPIRKSAFEKRVAEIRSFTSISLADITVDDRDERARFMPTQGPLATGYLHLTFPSHPPPEVQQPLSLFRLSAFPLGIIGVASCSSDPFSKTLKQFEEILSDIRPQGSMFPLVQQCFAFEDEGGDGSQLTDHVSGVEAIPSMDTKKTKLHLGTLLASLCSRILGELSLLIRNLESPVGNEYLNSGLFSTIPLSTDFPLPLDSNQNRDQTQSYNAQQELSAATTLRKSTRPITLKRNSSIGPGTSFRQATLPSPQTNKKRVSVIGATSSHGRLFKVLGDLFLLAGRNEDATIWYTEAVVMFKSSADPVWHASALEGLATIPVLDAWASSQGGQNSSFSNAKEPWIEIADKLSQASVLYSKSSPSSDAEHHYSLLAHLYVTSVLRHTTLLFAVWSAKGWGPLGFMTMLNSDPNPHLPPTLAHGDQLTYVQLERLSSVTGIKRSQISETLNQCHGPWLLHLGPRDRVSVLEAIARFYGCLGYKRKEAYVLREVLGCVMDLVVCGREQHEDYHGRPTEPGVQSFTIPPAPSDTTAMVGVRENESADGNESIMRLVKYVCRVHGIDLEAVKVVDTNALEASNEDGDSSKHDSDLFVLDEEPFSMEPVGWPELQIGIVREAIAVSEALPDHPSVAQCCLSALKTLYRVMPSADQIQLYTAAARALATARRRGDPRCVEYWSGRPVVTVEMTSLPLIRMPIEKDISVLQVRRSETSVGLPGVADPFLYNPRRLTTGKGRLLVVQNEDIEFRVTLRNPYVFDLELSSLSLSTSGVNFEANPISATIPSNSFHAVTITGRALETGALTIRGCRVQAPGGLGREFTLPLSTEEEEERIARRRSAIECEFGRSKYSGLTAHSWAMAVEKRNSIPVALAKRKVGSGTEKAVRYMEFKVVPELPLMRIRRTSLTHGAVMLYNGEKSTIWITLENISSLPIDFLNLTFEDSTMGPAQQALADGELSVFDTYETEYDLIHRKVLSWEGKNHTMEISPGKKTTVTVNCFGKSGCTNGTIHVSYAHTKSVLKADPPAEVFHTRQLSCPILVTVYHMLECYDMNIISYSDVDHRTGISMDDYEDSSYERDDGDGWCLFSIEVRNTYGLPFEVTFERTEGDSSSASTTCLVAPGSTSRIVLPLRKLSLSADQVSKPVPTLSDRQFVVDKSNLSSTEEMIRRELFWYREELFKCVRGRWKEAGGSRSGDLALRQQRLTMPMLRALRTDITRVKMDLLRYDPDSEAGEAQPAETIGRRNGKVLLQPNEFAYLRTRMTNLSASPLILTANLFFEPSRHIIFQGVLLNIPIGKIESGEERDVEIPVCFVSCGKFDLHAEIHVFEASQDERVAGRGQLTAIVREK